MPESGPLAVYLEVGARRTFAGVLAWPGWCRSGAGEREALDALGAYTERFRGAVGPAARRPSLPRGDVSFEVVERLAGDATTDVGAPGAIPAFDHQPLSTAELRRQLRVLQACWETFDRVVVATSGRPLRKGPRGGGRDLDKIRTHVVEGDGAYLSRLGGRFRPDGAWDDADAAGLREAFAQAAEARARGQVADRGPRGGARWPARYAIRRSAWHVLDHAWEIEDRSAGGS